MNRLLRKLSWIYLGLALFAFTADVFIWNTTKYRDQTATCNFYDAMLIMIECREFVGSNALESFLNWPLQFYYFALFARLDFAMVILAILIWSPIIFLLWTYFRKLYAAIHHIRS